MALEVLVAHDGPDAPALAARIDAHDRLHCRAVVGSLAAAARAMSPDPPAAVAIAQTLGGIDIESSARVLTTVAPDVAVVLLADALNPIQLRSAFEAGVRAVVHHDAPEVADVVHAAIGSHPFVHAATAIDLIERGRTARELGAEHGLTPRELEVLDLMGRGADPTVIADQLGISRHTARGHVKRILAKLDAHSQLEAVVVAGRKGLLRALAER